MVCFTSSPPPIYQLTLRQPSYHIVPPTATKVVSLRDTANSFGLHDTLQYGPRRLDAELNEHNPLEHRLKNVSPLSFAFSLLTSLLAMTQVGRDARLSQVEVAA
jgi:hypothetical protein